jgi:hypothetical protein
VYFIHFDMPELFFPQFASFVTFIRDDCQTPVSLTTQYTLKPTYMPTKLYGDQHIPRSYIHTTLYHPPLPLTHHTAHTLRLSIYLSQPNLRSPHLNTHSLEVRHDLCQSPTIPPNAYPRTFYMPNLHLLNYRLTLRSPTPLKNHRNIWAWHNRN